MSTKLNKRMASIQHLKTVIAAQNDCFRLPDGKSEKMETEIKYEFRIPDDPYIGFLNGDPIKRTRFVLEASSKSVVFGEAPELPPGYELGEGSRVLSPEKFQRMRGDGWVKKLTKYTRFGNEKIDKPTPLHFSEQK